MATTHLSRCSHNQNNNEINRHGVGSHTHNTHSCQRATAGDKYKTNKNRRKLNELKMDADPCEHNDTRQWHDFSHNTYTQFAIHTDMSFELATTRMLFFYFRESGKYFVTIACNTHWKLSKRTTSPVIELQRWQTRHETVIREKSKTKRLHSPFTGSNNARTGKSNTRTQHPNWIIFENLLYFDVLWSFVILF